MKRHNISTIPNSYFLIPNSCFFFFLFSFFFFLSLPLRAQPPRVLTYEDALETASENSPDIRQARFSLTRSRELLNAQEAALKSRFSFTLEPFYYSRENTFNTLINRWNQTEIKSSSGMLTIAQPVLLTDGTLALRNQFGWRDAYSEFQGQTTETFSNNLYITYDQPIFTFNRTRLALEEVKLDLENASLNYRIQELRLESNVARQFYTAYQSKMSLQVAREEYQNREQSYQIIRNKVDAGLAAREELYQAELDLTSSRSQVQNEKVSLENALDELKRLLGIDIFEDITVVAEIEQAPVEVDLNKAIEHGLKNRFELRQRNIDIELSRAGVIQASSTNEFQGNVSLSYGIIGNSEEFNTVYETPTKNQKVSLSLDIPIWDWGEKKSRTKAAEASVRRSELTFDEEKKDIVISIRQAYRNLQNQALQIELARQNVESAQLTYDINLERYENGDLTSMDLNLFQNQLSQKKIGLVNAKIQYKMQLLGLKIESLWDFENNQPVFLLEEN